VKRAIGLGVVVVGLLLAAPAAADLSPKDEAKRTQLFKEGRTAFDEGKWQDAADRFRAVVEMRSAPKALIALAAAEEKLGHLAEAKRLYERAREDAQAVKLTKDQDEAAARLRELLPRVPRIKVRVPSGVSDAAIAIDGKPAEIQFGDADVDPGEHTVTVTASGRKEFREVVTVAEGERKEVEVTLDPLQAEGPPPPPPDEGLGAPPIGAIILAGVGVGAGAAGAVMWGLGRGKEAEIQEQCGGVTQCPVSLKPGADAAAFKIILGDVLVGVGGAAIIGGGIWWLTSGGKSEPAQASQARPRVVVSPTRGGVWASFETTF
jgi:hypothetical protein